MTELSGKRRSLWLDTTEAPEHPALPEDLEVDVAVVGGGITGLTTALLCARDGARVALLEADVLGGGVTGNTTAKVSALQGTVYSELRGRFGADGARTYAEANQAGVERVAALIDELHIDCDLRRRAAYTYTGDPGTRSAIDDEVRAARDAGLAAELVTETPLPYPVEAAVRLDDQLEIHAHEYVLGLARALTEAGGRIFEQTTADGLRERGGPELRTRTGHTVKADHVVVATLMPFLDRGLFFTRLTPKRSYCIAVRTTGAIPDGMFISAESPTRSLRPALLHGEEVLIVGGEGHTTGEDPDTTERYAALERWARDQVGAIDVTHRWSAHDLQPADGIPYVGNLTPVSKRVWTAAGFRKWGFSNGTMAAEILADRIAGRENARAGFFDANRFDPLKAAKGMAAEQIKDARHFLGDRLRSTDFDTVDDLEPGQGGHVKVDGDLVAAYRDDAGRLHGVSPVCTHLACRVRFNTAERSWDCPCHGSRFAPDGTVLQGPATAPLAPKELGTRHTGA